MSELNKQLMINSYRNISFYGERRGEQEHAYYTELLKEDLESLGDNIGNYETKFIDKVMNYFYKQSNCASAFICGPANFNNRRNEKRWNSRDKALNDFTHWRDKYFKAVNRVRTLSPEAEIDVAIARLEFLETEKAKTGKYKFNMTDEEKESCCTVYNCTTKIRETKKKIIVMKNRIESKENQKTIHFKGGSIYIENDRVIIAHDGKPDRDIIQAIKKNGFRWSPKMGNWCRKHTLQAMCDAKYLLNNTLGGEV